MEMVVKDIGKRIDGDYKEVLEQGGILTINILIDNV